MDAAKAKLRDLRTEREGVARQLAQAHTDLPTVEELMPSLRERLQNIEKTLQADLAQGRLALGALLGDQRLRVHRDGAIEGAVRIQPEEKLPVPRSLSRPAVRMVAGEGFEPPTSGL